MFMKKPILLYAIVGPTAAGKTQLALEWAEQWKAHIIVCDAFQIRQGLPILTAKPLPEEQNRAPHHLLNTFPLLSPLSAADFAQAADAILPRLLEERIPVLLCGGSGLYLRALVQGLFHGPGANPALRQQLQEQAQTQGLPTLYRQLQEVDPLSAARIHVADQVRIVRALEVFLQTGKPLSVWHHENQQQPPKYELAYVGVDPGPAPLRQRIQQRILAMFQAGVAEEVAQIHAQHGTLPYVPLGYNTILRYIQGQTDLTATQQQLCIETAQYAKRQRTWFRTLPVHWFESPRAAYQKWVDV